VHVRWHDQGGEPLGVEIVVVVEVIIVEQVRHVLATGIVCLVILRHLVAATPLQLHKAVPEHRRRVELVVEQRRRRLVRSVHRRHLSLPVPPVVFTLYFKSRNLVYCIVDTPYVPKSRHRLL
jgi:hypothetical protein